jgi:outer membrane lipoprotein LolB
MRRLAVTALCALVLGGCASVAPVERVDAPLPVLSPNWTLQGRIGVQSGEQSLSGRIQWQHRAESDDVLMTSPLGQGVARIVRDADGVMLEMPNQPTRRAADAETLTREALGYVLPVAGLAWWVQGRPAPTGPFESTADASGRVAQIKQDGWVIDYLEYAADARPRRMVVAREGLQIRLVADNWLVQ